MTRQLVLPALLSMVLFATGQAAWSRSSPGPEKIVMANIISEDGTSFGRYISLIYREAFRRLGLDLVYVLRPPLRGEQESDFGVVDGQLGRGRNYGANHPNVVRVEEPAFMVHLAAFSTNPSMQLQGWESLRGKNLRIEYRMGVKAAQAMLEAIVPAGRLSNVANSLQGLQKIAIGRTDVYIDFDEYIVPLLGNEKFVGREHIVKAGTMETMAVHAYLHRKHAALAPKLSEVLRQMKKEGLMASYMATARGGDDVAGGRWTLPANAGAGRARKGGERDGIGDSRFVWVATRRRLSDHSPGALP